MMDLLSISTLMLSTETSPMYQMIDKMKYSDAISINVSCTEVDQAKEWTVELRERVNAINQKSTKTRWKDRSKRNNPSPTRRLLTKNEEWK